MPQKAENQVKTLNLNLKSPENAQQSRGEMNQIKIQQKGTIKPEVGSLEKALKNEYITFKIYQEKQ